MTQAAFAGQLILLRLVTSRGEEDHLFDRLREMGGILNWRSTAARTWR